MADDGARDEPPAPSGTTPSGPLEGAAQGPLAGLLAANRDCADDVAAPGLAGRAVRGVALVTCMDSRIDPLGAFGLVRGDVKIVRNAGGRVTADVLRSLLFSTTFLDVTHVVVMHHTDCALARLDDAAVLRAIDPAQAAAAEGWALLTMADPDSALEDDVRAVRACPALPGDLVVVGWRYDVETGLVEQLVR